MLALSIGVSHWSCLRVGAPISSQLYTTSSWAHRETLELRTSPFSQGAETVSCPIPVNLLSWPWEVSKQADGSGVGVDAGAAALGELWGWRSCLPFQREPYGYFDSSHQIVSGDLEIWGRSLWGIFLGRGACQASSSGIASI